MKFSALRRVPPGLFDNTSSWILKERLLPASSRMNEQKKKGDAFYSAAAEEESSHRSSFPTSTTFSRHLLSSSFLIHFFFLFHLLLHDEILVPSLFITPVPKKRTEKQVWLLHQDSYDLLPAFFFFFLTSGGGTCCRDLYTYHNASLIADQCISMFHGGGKQRRRD